MRIDKRYLHVPIRNGAEMQHIRLLEAGRIVRYFDAEVAAAGEPDWIAGYDVSELAGKELEIEGTDAEFFQSDSRPELPGLYREPRRPRFHFSPRTGWTNDPNGLAYIDGTWHLFYQHNPFGIKWGNMHWGHAVSEDLVRWTERDDALFPDELGTMFSGGAVVDRGNTSGIGKGDTPPLVCFYTAAGDLAPEKVPFTQCVAYSTDGGKSFVKYGRNPVIPHIVGSNRDPKVIRHEPSGSWIMALYLEKRGDDQVYSLFRSPDLLSWESLHEVTLPGSGECPDFFPLPVDGDDANLLWLFWGADGHYLLGTFDGRRFTPTSGPFTSIVREKGRGDGYAAQTFDNAPGGRRILVAWQQGDIPESRFNQSMAFPVELSLKTFSDGARLCAEPVREIESLYADVVKVRDVTLSAEPRNLEVSGEHLDICVEIEPESDATMRLEIFGIPIIIDAGKRTIRYRDSEVVLRGEGAVAVRLLVDRSSIELFADSGRCWFARRDFPDYSKVPLSVSGEGTVSKITVHELQGGML